jgi:PGF-CTERM protein
MKIWYVAVFAALLALISVAPAQNPIESLAGSLQSQAKAAGEQLQQKAAQHISPAELEQRAKEELKNQLNQKLNHQPGFSAALAVLAIFAAVCLIKRRD